MAIIRSRYYSFPAKIGYNLLPAAVRLDQSPSNHRTDWLFRFSTFVVFSGGSLLVVSQSGDAAQSVLVVLLTDC